MSLTKIGYGFLILLAVLVFLLAGDYWVNSTNSRIEYPSSIDTYVSKALTFYPELSSTAIEFRFEDQAIAHSSRPDAMASLNPLRSRAYIIRISTQLPPVISNSLFKNLPDSAKIGVLSHELAHIVDYERMSGSELFGFGFRYLSDDGFIDNYEKRIDSITVGHGAGHYLAAWSRHVELIFDQDGRGERYLTPEEIYELMELH